MEDFHRARRRASMSAIMNRLAGKSDDLFSYEEVRKQLRAIESADRKLKDIPINAIIGSVNRYTDFTRNFLPRRSLDAQRWARVKAAGESMVGLPPIEVYQIGEAFFVLDGNHRVSIARQAGNKYVQAYVKEVSTRVPLTPDTQANDLIIKTEYLDFLEQIQIDQIRPQTDLRTTSPGRYPFIQQQIEAIHFAIEFQKGTKVPYRDAVIYWHDKIYLPIVEVIRERKLLGEFPERTETDLFIWIYKYQYELATELGWDITPESTATALTSRFSTKSKQLTTRLKNAYRTWLYGPPTGKWREEQLAARQGRMFADVLVVLTGRQNDQYALEFGIYIAQMEGSQLFGLYISQPNKGLPDPRINRIQSDFDRLCSDANVSGNLAVAFERNPVNQIIRRASFADIVVLSMGSRLLNESRYASLIQNCPTPIITIPGQLTTPLKKALLAYDGSPKAEEALYLAAYTTKFWELTLVVLAVEGNKFQSPEALVRAGDFLDRFSVEADFIKASGPPAKASLTFAIEEHCDLIIIGGYGTTPIKKRLTGSIVDEIIKAARQPVLICR
jgi:nucleotide-binding universal stress UspA family protein